MVLLLFVVSPVNAGAYPRDMQLFASHLSRSHFTPKLPMNLSIPLKDNIIWGSWQGSGSMII